MSIHDDIGNAEVTGRTPFIIDGIYQVLQVEKIVEKVSAKNARDELMIFEFAVLESSVEGRPAGSRVSRVINFSHGAPAAGEARGLLAAIMGCAVDEISPDVSRLLVSEKQPATGRLIRIEANSGPTKGGGTFTYITPTALPEERQAQAADLRQAAGFDPLPPQEG